MFSLTKCCRIRAHRKTQGNADDCDFIATGRARRLGRALSAQILVMGLVAFIWASPAHGQVLYGSMVGNVTDPNGAAVPGAKVEAVNRGTRATKSVTTDENGSFSFTDLTPGIYNVTFSAASFKKELRETVQIDANK